MNKINNSQIDLPIQGHKNIYYDIKKIARNQKIYLKKKTTNNNE